MGVGDATEGLLARLVDEEHPWLGLESFHEETRRFFFGRDAEIAQLDLMLRTQPLLVLYGRSGLGKTSILRAGLLPLMEKGGHRPALARLTYTPHSPRGVEQLIALLLQDLGMVPDERQRSAHKRERAWWDGARAPFSFDLPEDGHSRLWLLLHSLSQRPAVTHLILDQFEEIFTLGAEFPGAESELRDALSIFLQGAVPPAIAEAIANHAELLDHFDPDSKPVRVVLALRDDWVFALHRWQRHIPSITQNCFELLPLRGNAAFQAVFCPGTLRCAPREDGSTLPPIVAEETAQRIVRFVAKAPADAPMSAIEAVPPILSLLCRELNERRLQNPGVQTIEFEESTTDVEGIITAFYERCLSKRPEAVRVFIEERLVSDSGVRLQQDRRSLLAAFRSGCDIPGAHDGRMAVGYNDPAAAQTCLEEVVTDRLLTPVGGGENPFYELIHDLLAGVVVRSRTAREERMETERAEMARQREEKLKHDAEARAEQERQFAEDYARQKELAVQARATAEEALVRAEAAAEMEQVAKKRMSRLSKDAAVIVSIFVLGLIGVVIWALKERANALEQRGKAESAEAAAVGAQKQAFEARDRAERLLIEASIADQRRAQQLLHDGLWQEALAHLDRASRYWPANRGALAQLWLTLRYGHAATCLAPLASVPLQDFGLSLKWSLNGRFLLAHSKDATATLFDTETNTRVNGKIPLVITKKDDFYSLNLLVSNDGFVTYSTSDEWGVLSPELKPQGKVQKEDGERSFHPQVLFLDPVSGHSQLILQNRGSRECQWVDAKTGGIRSRWTFSRFLRPADVFIHPTKAQLYLTGSTGEVLIDADAKTPLSILKFEINDHTDQISGWDAAGKLLLVNMTEVKPQWRIYTWPPLSDTAPIIKGNGIATWVLNGKALGVRTQDEAYSLRFPDREQAEWTYRFRGIINSHSGDGSRVMLIDEKAIVVRDVLTFRPVAADRFRESLERVAFDREGRRLASLIREGSTAPNGIEPLSPAILRWELPAGSVMEAVKPLNVRLGEPQRSPNGEWEALASPYGVVEIYHRAEGKNRWTLYLPGIEAQGVGWEEDGRIVWVGYGGEPGLPDPRWTLRMRWSPPTSDDEAIRNFATLVGGKRFTKDGALIEAGHDERAKWRDQLKTANPSDPAWQELKAWWLGGRPGTDTPGGKK